MSIRGYSSLKLTLLTSLLLSACATRQLAIDHPLSADGSSDPNSAQSTQSKQFQALPGFPAIDGDDYYVRLNTEFEFKGDNVLKSGCNNLAPSYEKNDLSSTLIFSIHNDVIKFKNETPGFVYQAGTGKCNFKFEAKKQILTPWIRLDLAKETDVDYSFISSANSNVDVGSLVSDVTAASSLLSVTGVGMGVAVIGQFAGQWVKNNQQTAAQTAPATTAAKSSSESHSLPPAVSYSGKTGMLNQTNFVVYAVAEGGINLLKSETQPLGELKMYPEITASLLLKNSTGGLPDARDLSLDEINYAPIKSASGEIKLSQLLEQSQHPAKPDLTPNWGDYQNVVDNCRKLKLVLKDLGFNKFDRNAYLYYFLTQSKDWQNYNINPQSSISDENKAKAIAQYGSKNFSGCLSVDDFVVMKAMGLKVNTQADWQQVNDSIQKQEQSLLPLKSIERQLGAVLRNSNSVEMERQLFPLLTTQASGDGTVLLQDNLGDFGLEKLLVDTPPAAAENAAAPAAPVVAPIPGQGLVVSAHQLAHVFSSLGIQDLSCARPLPAQQGSAPNNMGIILFTTKNGSVRAKGAAIEFEFAGGKVNRVAFQSPTFRDFEQDLTDHVDIGGCRIDSAFVAKLH